MAYAYQKEFAGVFGQGAASLEAALAVQGFGIISRIDVQKTMREKLGKEMEGYLILGACSPSHAYAAIGAEPGIGALLPCNATVRQEGGKVLLACVLPTNTVALSGNAALEEPAAEIERKLKAAVDAACAGAPGRDAAAR